jgi:hypothetical protein
MKQTAVEWLIDHWKKLQSKGEKMSWNQIIQITELVKEMEKEQIIDAHGIKSFKDCKQGVDFWTQKGGEKYYNETYGGNK